MIEEKGPYAVIISDMRMPEMDGIQFLAEVQSRAPNTVRMMLTGNADLETAVAAVNDGNVFRFITKPCPTAMLSQFIDAGVRQYRLITAERELLEGTLRGAVRVCTEILSSVDERTYGHALKVRELVRPIAKSLGIEDLWQLEIATLLAQIGNATIPPVVLVRRRHGSQLSGAERDMLSKIPERGYQLLASIPRLESVARLVLYAEKNFDGTGFPNDAVSGDSIPIGSRLIKIVSDFIQLESSGESKLRALEAMKLRSGAYDPDIFAIASPHLIPSPDGAIEASTLSLLVAFEDLAIGDLLTSNVESADGLLIVSSGSFVTSTLLERMKNFVKINSVREPIGVERKAAWRAAALV
jgi:response regulator RpfG family c-di-GMP phosphodiesterase